jgi:ankyrin repeat protein
MAPLHEAVLLGSLESVNKWIPRSDKDERNFLGQTPIHLAISNSRHLRALINAGHDLDAVDNYGFTPLMYAAATNQEECLRVLLEADANPMLRDTLQKRTFMHYAAISGHWNLILRVIYQMKAVAEKKTTESWAQCATILYYVFYPDYHQDREVSFQQLLAMCGSVNFTFDHRGNLKELQNNTLLHHVRSANDIEVLLEQGFTLVNHVNGTGQHALMSAVLKQRNPDVVRRLLDAGAEINLNDNSHYTILYYVLDKLQRPYEKFKTMDIARILLANGADVLCRDSCRCPCSPNGCLPSALLQHVVCEGIFSAGVTVWSLEWLSLALEYRGKSEAKTILLSFIRKRKFDEMEMTHVCCTRNHISLLFRRPSMSDEDIDDILDEESEFVQILEDEMALSSAKVYETLLDNWILQIKASLEKSCETAVEYNKRFPCNESPYQVLLELLPLL